jgi:protein-S-isoprenylcysteine O-methyltransferase Ste14
MPDEPALSPGLGKIETLAKYSGLHRTRSWFSIVILAPAATVALFSAPHFGPQSWQEFCCYSLGWSLFLAGAAMRWWGTLYVGGRKSSELVTSGPYSLCRNPIYVGTFLLTLSVGVLAQSALFLLAVLAAKAYFLGVTVPDEEALLRQRHGASFIAYCERVPRFFPRFKLFSSPTTIEVHVSGLRTEFWRMCRWAWIPVLCDLATHLRGQPWWPIWFWVP